MTPDKKKLSFIIADDDAEDQNLIQNAIKAIDISYEYTSVFNGTQLLDLLLKRGVYKLNNQSHPDAVILDINMPVMDGLSALGQLNSIPELQHIPVFILYTSGKAFHPITRRASGVAGIYVKPSSAGEINRIVREIHAIVLSRKKQAVEAATGK